MKKMMKRIAAVLLATALAAGFSLTAFADDTSDVHITKSYSTTDGETFPAETLTFTVTADSNNPGGADCPMITVGSDDKFSVTELTDDMTAAIPVNLPTYTTAGVYKYTIKENAGSTQGVTYGTNEITIAVLVGYEGTTLKVLDCGVEQNEDGNKEDAIVNEYKLGGGDPDDPDGPGTNSLSVKKVVEGSLGDPDKLFTIKVTFSTESGKKVYSDITVSGGTDSGNTQTITGDGWTGDKEITIKLKHDETVTFDKIPDGISYTVEEDPSHIAAGDTQTIAELNGEEGYLVTYADETGTITEGSKPAAVVTNTKDTTVNTGISLDSLPYLLILAAVAVGAFVIFRRRRTED